MRPKSAILLVLALGCGLVAAIGINQVMSNRGEATVVKGETTPIFVALHQIGINDKLKPEDIKLVEWPKDKVPEGAITKLEDIDDRRAWTPIFPEEPIVNNKLLAKGETGIGTLIIPKGMRVVTVRVDDVASNAGLLKPGDVVDLSVHLKANDQDGITQSISKTFLQKVKVAAVGQVINRAREGEQASTARTVSFFVTPEQVELVTQASEIGSIRLSMRDPNDEAVAETGDGIDGIEVLTGKTSTKDVKSPLDDMLKKPEPPTTTVAVMPAPVLPPVEDHRDRFTMTVWEGSTAHQVKFVDGKPEEPILPNGIGGMGLPSTQPPAQTAPQSAAPAAPAIAPEITPPATEPANEPAPPPIANG